MTGNGKADAVLNTIKAFIKDKGYPPTVREIASKIGLKSSSTVHHYLDQLEKQGKIKKSPSVARAIKVIE